MNAGTYIIRSLYSTFTLTFSGWLTALEGARTTLDLTRLRKYLCREYLCRTYFLVWPARASVVLGTSKRYEFWVFSFRVGRTGWNRNASGTTHRSFLIVSMLLDDVISWWWEELRGLVLRLALVRCNQGRFDHPSSCGRIGVSPPTSPPKQQRGSRRLRRVAPNGSC